MQPVNEAQKQFFDDFEKRTGARPVDMELVSIEASRATLTYLNLTYPIGQAQLWGLLIFCQDRMFFYSHPADYTICGFRPRDNVQSQQEQFLDFSRFVEAKAAIHGGRSWLSRLFEPVNQIDLELTGEDGKKVMCLLKTTGKVSAVAEKINARFSETAATSR